MKKWFWNALKGLAAFIQVASPLLKKWSEYREQKKRQQAISSPDPLIDSRRQRLRVRTKKNRDSAICDAENSKGDSKP